MKLKPEVAPYNAFVFQFPRANLWDHFQDKQKRGASTAVVAKNQGVADPRDCQAEVYKCSK